MPSLRDEFLNDLKKNKKIVIEQAKETSGSLMDDHEICDLLELDEDTRSTFSARLSRAYLHVDKNKQKCFMFIFTLTDEHKGLTLSRYLSLDSKDKERYRRTIKTTMGYLQRLGYDTTEWDDDEVLEKLIDSVEEVSAAKPRVTLALSRYVPDDEDKPHRLNMSIVSLIQDSEDSEEAEEGEEEELPTPKATKGKKSTKKAPEPEHEEEEEEEESDEEEESGEDGPWIGYQATFDSGDGDVTVTTKSYNDGVYVVEDEDGDEYEIEESDLTWIEE